MNKETVHGKTNSQSEIASEVNILSSIKQIANKQNISAGITSGQKLKIKPGTAGKGTIPTSGSQARKNFLVRTKANSKGRNSQERGDSNKAESRNQSRELPEKTKSHSTIGPPPPSTQESQSQKAL